MVLYGRQPKVIQSGYMAGKRNVKTSRRGGTRGTLGMIAAMRSKSTEVKTVDFTNPATGTGQNFNVFGTTAGSAQINAISLGTEVFNRIGRKIHMKSVHIRGAVLPTGQAPGNELLRCVLVYDRQTNTSGSAPVYSDIFTSQNTAGTATALVWDFTNTTNFDRFVILRDWKYSCPNPPIVLTGNASNAITDYKGEYRIDEYIKLNNLVAHYGQAGVSGSAPVTGGLYLFFIGTVANATAGYQLAWNARIRFSDGQ